MHYHSSNSNSRSRIIETLLCHGRHSENRPAFVYGLLSELHVRGLRGCHAAQPINDVAVADQDRFASEPFEKFEPVRKIGATGSPTSGRLPNRASRLSTPSRSPAGSRIRPTSPSSTRTATSS